MAELVRYGILANPYTPGVLVDFYGNAIGTGPGPFIPATGSFTFSESDLSPPGGPTLYTPLGINGEQTNTGIVMLPEGETLVPGALSTGRSYCLVVGLSGQDGGLLCAYTGTDALPYNVTQPGAGQGNWTITWDGFTTGVIAGGSTAATVLAAIQAMGPQFSIVEAFTNASGGITIRGGNGLGTPTATGALIGQTLPANIFVTQDPNNLPIMWSGVLNGSSAGHYEAVGSYADNVHALGWFGDNKGGTGTHGYSYINKWGSAPYDMGAAPNFHGNGLQLSPLLAPTLAANANPTSNRVFKLTPPATGTYTLTLNGGTTTALGGLNYTFYTVVLVGTSTFTLNGNTTPGQPYNVTNSALASALNALPGVSGVMVTGGSGLFTVAVPTALLPFTSNFSNVVVLTPITYISQALRTAAGNVNVVVTGSGGLSLSSPYAINSLSTLGALTTSGATVAETTLDTSGATTYYYVATAVNNAGTETVVSNEVSIVPSGSNPAVQLVISQNWGMGQVNIYRGTSTGAYTNGLIAHLNTTPNNYGGTIGVALTDSGLPTQTGTPPTAPQPAASVIQAWQGQPGTNDVLEVQNFSGTPQARIKANGTIVVAAAGSGLQVAEGSNAKQGIATLSAGTAVVANSNVTANSRIFLSVQSLGTVTVPKALGITGKVAGTAFTITSADITDTSVVAYEIFEPGL